MKSYKLFTESKINQNDFVKIQSTAFLEEDRKKLYVCLGKYYNENSPPAKDGKENLFILVNALDNIKPINYETRETRTLHKDYLRKATEEEIAQFHLEIQADKYNL